MDIDLDDDITNMEEYLDLLRIAIVHQDNMKLGKLSLDILNQSIEKINVIDRNLESIVYTNSAREVDDLIKRFTYNRVFIARDFNFNLEINRVKNTINMLFNKKNIFLTN